MRIKIAKGADGNVNARNLMASYPNATSLENSPIRQELIASFAIRYHKDIWIRALSLYHGIVAECFTKTREVLSNITLSVSLVAQSISIANNNDKCNYFLSHIKENASK